MASYTKNKNGTYSVNYQDQRFKDVETEKNQQINQTTGMYDSMINDSQKYYDQQIQAAQDYATQQSEIQQAQTDFNIQQIEQQKDQTEDDYIREQQGSYADFQKESNRYGVNAEQMASSGLSNTGYSESSRVNMYNTYQNRVATARDTYNRAIMNFNNQIQQATLSNNEILAEIAYNALQTQLQLSQQAFEYKNQLVLAKESALQDLNDRYYARFQDVLTQVNREIDIQLEIDKINREYKQWTEEMKLKKKELNQNIKKSNAEIKQIKAQTKNIKANTAKTKAETKAIKTASKSSKTTTSTNPYSSTTKKTTKLSSAATKVYNDFNAQYSKLSSSDKKKAANTTANAMNTLANQGRITKQEAVLILQKLGIS